jgi:amino acid transporter
VGFLGLAMPVAIGLGQVIFDGGLSTTMSLAYYTHTRNILVGGLCAIGVFLLMYRGYDRKDNLTGKVASLCAIAAALFATSPEFNATLRESIISGFHAFFTVVLFMTQAIFSLFLFRKTDQTRSPTRKKIQRNRIYLVCGIAILVSLSLTGVIWFTGTNPFVKRLKPMFWIEALGMVSFGFSWLTKGQAILKDRARK